MKIKNTVFLLILFALGITSCNRGPYASTNKIYKRQAKNYAAEISKTPLQDSLSQTGNWVGTTNFNLRKPNFVILHHTAQNSCEQTLKTFTTAKSQVSAHYVICKNGTVHHMLNDYLRAWHGGLARWGNVTDINSVSIGIEIDNNGFEEFTEPQLTSLLKVLAGLKKAYGIPAENFIGHSDIAPTRKVDPNIHFPWERLARAGFGIWWSDTTNMSVPVDFSSEHALRILGYDMKNSAAAVKAFKRKFLRVESDGVLTEADRKILYVLLQQLK